MVWCFETILSGRSLVPSGVKAARGFDLRQKYSQTTPMRDPAFHGNGLDRVVTQRFEAKYILPEVEAEAVRDAIAPYTVPDPGAKFGLPYRLGSLYLDSPGLGLYWSSNLGEKNRFKLRVRAYSEDSGEPLFFEIKRRMDGVILKQRARVRRECFSRIVQGGEVRPEYLFGEENEEWENLCQFRDLLDQLEARPVLHVRYEREAFMSVTGEPVRITFDRKLEYLATEEQENQVRVEGLGWRSVEDLPVILEVKFTDVYPYWVRDLIRRFHLLRDSVAKYVVCVNALTREGFPVAGLSEE